MIVPTLTSFSLRSGLPPRRTSEERAPRPARKCCSTGARVSSHHDARIKGPTYWPIRTSGCGIHMAIAAHVLGPVSTRKHMWRPVAFALESLFGLAAIRDRRIRRPLATCASRSEELKTLHVTSSCIGLVWEGV